MSNMTPSLEKLIGQIVSLPGIGRKSATRIAHHLLSADSAKIDALIESIVTARSSVTMCSVCCNLSEADVCPMCNDDRRDGSTICVVEDPRSAETIDGLREFNGLFHVLHGVISPLDGIGPDKLKIKELIARITPEVKEVIIATNPSVEGEATAAYIARIVTPLGVKVTRLAYGLPVGATLEYADSVTLSRALEGRREL